MNNQEFLKTYNSADYEKPSVAVDLLIFTIEDDELKVLLINRTEPPFQNYLSLPGTFVGINETLDEAVVRCLNKKVGNNQIYFEQLYTWGDVNRDPRMRIISVSYLALAPIQLIKDALRTNSCHHVSVKNLLQDSTPLAFDHKEIIQYGRERVKNKAEYIPIAFQFLPNKFTLPQLQTIYEILLDKPLYKANFRKKIAPLVRETDQYTTGGAYRPSRLYERNDLE